MTVATKRVAAVERMLMMADDSSTADSSGITMVTLDITGASIN